MYVLAEFELPEIVVESKYRSAKSMINSLDLLSYPRSLKFVV